MPALDNVDDEARAELLCYLVVGHLIAEARTGTWLRTDHLVESARIWQSANGANFDWSERARLAHLSTELAPHVFSTSIPRDEPSLAKLFTDGWRLDYRSPVVQGVYEICARRLREA
ncbi:hypothetical protein LMG31841_01572 [Paraburkholderia saeva]|uniref:Uncharacterized protein n=1 Tax=Paraburkholderia saeva TaxID=2777537 RepID=A0A9N8RUJ9_9BURK|nr:hypothetical protein LMG31841_01572 [Paraburkholderia saeva]